MKKYLLVILAIAAFSCAEEHSITYSVQTELDPYVSEFYQEAANRGVTIPQNLVAEISDKAQSIADARSLQGQNYLYVNPAINPGIAMEAEIFEELTELFMQRNVTFSKTSQAERNAEFDLAFN